jgi:hypothetical protein
VDSFDSDLEKHNRILEASRELLARIKAALTRQGVEPPEDQADKSAPETDNRKG